MRASELTSQHIVRLVRHFFDPDEPPSKSSTRRLISPNIVLEFPFLPSAPSTNVTGSSSSPLQRHSTSAQALGAFHVPALVVNRVPGASWTMTVQDVKDVSETKQRELYQEPGSAIWHATITWKLELRPPVPLPFGISERITLHHADRRQVELLFAPVEGVSSPSEGGGQATGGPSSSPFRNPKMRSDCWDPIVKLVRVRYTGVRLPPVVRLLPLFDQVANVAPFLTTMFLAPLYGLILLAGLDRSTRSLDSSKKRRHREAKRQAKYSSGDPASLGGNAHRNSERSESAGADSAARRSARVWPSFADSPSSSPQHLPSIDIDDDSSETLSHLSSLGETSSQPDWPPSSAEESPYHRVMRQTRVHLNSMTSLIEALSTVLKLTGEEFGALGHVVRQAIVLFVQIGSSMLGAGAELVQAASATTEEAAVTSSHQDDWSRRRRLREHVRQRIKNQGEESEEDDSGVLYSPNLWRQPGTSGRKRVSFSLQDPYNPYAEDTDIDVRAFQARPNRSEREVTIDEQDSDGESTSGNSSSSSSDDECLPRASLVQRRKKEARTVSPPPHAPVAPPPPPPPGQQPRYHANFGLPAIATKSPLSSVRNKAAHEAAHEAVKRRPRLERTYSKDDGRVLTLAQEEEAASGRKRFRPTREHVLTPMPSPSLAVESEVATPSIESVLNHERTQDRETSHVGREGVYNNGKQQAGASAVGVDLDEEPGTSALALGVNLGPEHGRDHISTVEAIVEHDEDEEAQLLLGYQGTVNFGSSGAEAKKDQSTPPEQISEPAETLRHQRAPADVVDELDVGAATSALALGVELGPEHGRDHIRANERDQDLEEDRELCNLLGTGQPTRIVQSGRATSDKTVRGAEGASTHNVPLHPSALAVAKEYSMSPGPGQRSPYAVDAAALAEDPWASSTTPSPRSSQAETPVLSPELGLSELLEAEVMPVSAPTSVARSRSASKASVESEFGPRTPSIKDGGSILDLSAAHQDSGTKGEQADEGMTVREHASSDSSGSSSDVAACKKVKKGLGFKAGRRALRRALSSNKGSSRA